MIVLLAEITVEFLAQPPAPEAERLITCAGVPCKHCTKRIMPVVFNNVMSPTAWTHLHKPFRYGAGCLCDDRRSTAEPLIERSE